MHIHSLFNELIFICSTKAEASKVWRDQPDYRSRIWMESEAAACILMNPEELQEVVRRKVERPGYVRGTNGA
jgi:hypothetical protein